MERPPTILVHVHHRRCLAIDRPSVGRPEAFVVQFGGREEAGATLKCLPREKALVRRNDNAPRNLAMKGGSSGTHLYIQCWWDKPREKTRRFWIYLTGFRWWIAIT